MTTKQIATLTLIILTFAVAFGVTSYIMAMV